MAATSAPECFATICTRPMWSMCWWVITICSMSAIEWPSSRSSCWSSSSELPELGPESTSVSGSSAIRKTFTRPTANGVGIAIRWMPASAAAA